MFAIAWSLPAPRTGFFAVGDMIKPFVPITANLSAVNRSYGIVYHLRDINIQTKVLTWLIFTYVFESWCA
jgi:hypothetical protein